MSGGPALDAEHLHAALAGEGPARLEALEELARHPPDASARVVDARLARALVATLASERRSEQRRAADVLAPIAVCAEPLRAALTEALRHPSQRVRWGAAYTLGRASCAPPDAWPVVREAMELADGDQRWAAAELACGLARRHPEVAGELRAALAAGTPTLRRMALYCLRDLAAEDGPALARCAFGDADVGVRLAAVSAASRAAPGSAEAASSAAALARLVEADPEPGVRRAAAAALGRLAVREASVLRALEDAAAGPDPSLARAARGALHALAGGG